MKTQENLTPAYNVNNEFLTLEVAKKQPTQILLKEVLGVFNTLTAIDPANPALPKGKPNAKQTKAQLHATYCKLCEAYTAFVTANPGSVQQPEAPKTKKAKKAAKTGNKRPSADQRLEMYSTELAQKEAFITTEEYKALAKPEQKVVRKRIASLHRKIARANKALGRVNAQELHPALTQTAVTTVEQCTALTVVEQTPVQA